MFEKTLDYKDYFPSFVVESSKRRETRDTIEEIFELFGDCELFTQNKASKLTRLLRLLGQFEDLVFIQLVRKEERIRIIQNVWNVVRNGEVSMSNRIRFANVLTFHISSYKRLYFRGWWHERFTSQADLEDLGQRREGEERTEFACKCQFGEFQGDSGTSTAECICGIIDCGYIMEVVEKECTRGYLEGSSVNVQKIKNFISSLTRILDVYRPFIEEVELEKFLENWLLKDKRSISFFVHLRLLVLVCNSSFSYKLLKSGRIFEIWDILNGQIVNYWDSAMILFISRGVRHAWRIGKNLECLYSRVPYLFQLLYVHLGIPILQNVVSSSLNTGTTSSTSSVSSGSSNSMLLQTKTPSLIREVISNEFLSAMTIKPINIFSKFAVIFTHLLKSLANLEPRTQTLEGKSIDKLKDELPNQVKAVPEALKNLVSIVYPLNHPSNVGKWSHGISIFVQALTYQYCKRIFRERVEFESNFERNENSALGRTKMIGAESEFSRLCRFDDEFYLTILFPLIEQGIYSKDTQVAGRYEDSLKRWTYILPDVLLTYLLNMKLMPALQGDTETHQVYIAFRILTTILPLIVQFIPQDLPGFMEISLQGIDISDPMKINQALFFLTILFYNLQQTREIKTLDFDEFDMARTLLDSKFGNKESTKLKHYVALYNYPKEGPYGSFSDKSLVDRREIPKEVSKFTEIDGRSPLEYYFKQNSDKRDGGRGEDFEHIFDNKELREDFYFMFNEKKLQDPSVLMNKYQQRKQLLDYIFNCWVPEFLERILDLLGNVVKPSEAANYSSSIDFGISYALRALIVNLLLKCKLFGYHQLLKDCFEMIGKWIVDNFSPDNYKYLSKILSAMGFCDPDLAFEAVLSKLLLKIGNECEFLYGKIASNLTDRGDYEKLKYIGNNSRSGTGVSTEDLESEDESFLLYYVSLVSSLIRYTRDNILKKRNREYYFGIYSLLLGLLKDSRRKVRRSGLKLQQRLIESLTHLQIVEDEEALLEARAESEDSELGAFKEMLFWGHPFHIGDSFALNITNRKLEWFSPNNNSLREVKNLLTFNLLYVLKLLMGELDSDTLETGSDLLSELFGDYLQQLEKAKDMGKNDKEIQDSSANFHILLESLSKATKVGGGKTGKERNKSSDSEENEGELIKKPSSLAVNNFFFCLNNLRILNKSVSSIFPRVTTDFATESEGRKSEKLSGLVLQEDLYREFEPFFSKYYNDVYRLVLFLTEICSGIQVIEVPMEKSKVEESLEEQASITNSTSGGKIVYYKLKKPRIKITNTEEIKFRTKLIRTASQCLNHYYSSSTNLSLSSLYNIDFSDSILAWLSYTNGIHYQSSLRSSPRVFLLKNVHYFWNKRINIARHEYSFFGERRKLVYLMAFLSLSNYNIVRKAAQLALKESLNSHISSRNQILQFILFEVYFSISIFKLFQEKGKKESSMYEFLTDLKTLKPREQDATGDFGEVLKSNCRYVFLQLEPNKGSSKGDLGNLDNSFSTSAVQEFLNSHLSGFSHIIVSNGSLIRSLWNQFELLLHTFILICHSSSLKLDQENIPVRLLNCLNCLLCSRDFDSLLFHQLGKGSNRGSFASRQSYSLGVKLEKLLDLLFEPNWKREFQCVWEINSHILQSVALEEQNEKMELKPRFPSNSCSYTLRIAKLLLDELGLTATEYSADNFPMRRSMILLTYLQGIIVSIVRSGGTTKDPETKSVITQYWNYLWKVLMDTNKLNSSSFLSMVLFSLTSFFKTLFEFDSDFLTQLAKKGDILALGNLKNLLENVADVASYVGQISNDNPNLTQSSLIYYSSSSSQSSSYSLSSSGLAGSVVGSSISRIERKMMNITNASIITNHLVLNFTSIFNSFPYHRFRCYSNNLSLTNFIFFQQLFWLLKTREDKGGGGLEAILETLQDWCRENGDINLEKEKHLLILEALSAVFSCSFAPEMDQFLDNQSVLDKNKLVNILHQEFQRSDQTFIFSLMDFVKYSLTPSVRQEIPHYFKEIQARPPGEQRASIPSSPYLPPEMAMANGRMIRLLLNFTLNPFGGAKDLSQEGIEVKKATMECVTSETLPTFEMIKLFRIYQSGLTELLMNIDFRDDSVLSEFQLYLRCGLDLFKAAFDKENNFRQLREEMSNVLHSLVVAGNWTCFSGSGDSFKSILVKEFRELISAISEDLDGLIEVAERDKQERKNQDCVLSRLEVILYYCLLGGIYSDKQDSKLGVEDLVPFSSLFEIISKLQLVDASGLGCGSFGGGDGDGSSGDDGNDGCGSGSSQSGSDIPGLSYSSLMFLLVTRLSTKSYGVPLEALLDGIVESNSCFAGLDTRDKSLEAGNGFCFLKSKLFKIRVNTIIGEFYSPILNNSPTQIKILNNVISGLFEDHADVKYVSKLALCSLFRALPSSVCVQYIELFKSWVGGTGDCSKDARGPISFRADSFFYLLSASGNGDLEGRFFGAGVFGLISAVLSHPFDVPYWLPETITFLASSSNSKSISQVLKKQIQECIQEFLKSHQDGWNFIHKHKFSHHQLEILDMYKGRPVYFT
ncbi:hypothetical protein HWI79_3258 [Cryptosporidium felis]|nr:hypothetical protein HWI79_3258 [Cryptosporidium felis]